MHIRLKKDINSFDYFIIVITSLLLISVFSLQLFYLNLNYTHHIFGSDTLQHYFLTQFLNEGSDFWNNFFSWNFGPAPSIFPDFILVYLFYNIFNSVFWSVYTIALLQILTTYWLIILITKHIDKNNTPNPTHLPVVITSALFLIIFTISSSTSLQSFFNKNSIEVYPLIYFTNYHYAPVVIGGLIMILLCLQLEQIKSNRLNRKVNYLLVLIIFLISFLINLSDLFFFSSVVVPIMVTYCILGVITKDKIKKYILPMTLFTSGLSAHFIKDFLFINRFTNYIALKFKLFDILNLLKTIFLDQTFLTILLLVFFGSVFYRLRKDFLPLAYKWKNKETVLLSTQEFNNFFILLLSTSSLFIGIASLQAVGGVLYPRYLIFIFFIPLFFTGVLRFTFLTNKWVASVLSLIAFSLSAYTMIPPKNSIPKLEYQNSDIVVLIRPSLTTIKNNPIVRN